MNYIEKSAAEKNQQLEAKNQQLEATLHQIINRLDAVENIVTN